MRHGKKFNHLGRKKAHRKAMLSNMACSLIEHKCITTTVPKAKALRQYVEPLVTRSKEDSTHSRRVCFRYLKSKQAVSELFTQVAPAVESREGGYTRIVRTGKRLGDNADMCLIELVDFNELYGSESKPKKKRSRRSRRGGAVAPAATPVAAPEAKAEEAPAAEAAPEAKAEEAPAAEAAAEAAPEAKAEEAPAAEAAPEAAAEAKAEEAPAAEATPEAKAEEAPAAEAAPEAKAEEAPAAEAAPEAKSEEAPPAEAAPEAKAEEAPAAEAAPEAKADEGEAEGGEEKSTE
jgi:large subunit ribosomal protein L17